MGKKTEPQLLMSMLFRYDPSVSIRNILQGTVAAESFTSGTRKKAS